MIIFGIIIIFLIDSYYVYARKCISEYYWLFDLSYYYPFSSDNIEVYRHYTIINNTKIYFSQKRSNVTNFKGENFKYDFKNYPILKELNDIYKSTSFFKDEQVREMITDLFYYIVHFVFTPFFLFLTFIFFPIYKCCDKCKIAYYIFYIAFLILIFIFILYLTIQFNSIGNKEYLINDKEEIQYIIDDYNQYAKCVIKFPLAKIFEFIFFIILLFPLIFEMGCFKSCKYCNQEEEDKENEEEEKGELLPENENKIIIIFEIDQIKYFLNVDQDSKFEDIIIDFKNKYNNFKNKEIHSALFSGENLFSVDNKSKTIEQLKVKSEDTILINIIE